MGQIEQFNPLQKIIIIIIIIIWNHEAVCSYYIGIVDKQNYS